MAAPDQHAAIAGAVAGGAHYADEMNAEILEATLDRRQAEVELMLDHRPPLGLQTVLYFQLDHGSALGLLRGRQCLACDAPGQAEKAASILRLRRSMVGCRVAVEMAEGADPIARLYRTIAQSQPALPEVKPCGNLDPVAQDTAPGLDGHHTSECSMIDLNRIISGLSQSGAAAGLAGGLAGGTVVGALASKKGRKAAKSAAKIGGLALVGGLAYKAYRDYQEGQQRAGGMRAPAAAVGSPGFGTGPAADRWENVGRNQFAAVIEEPPEGESRSLLLVRAMIAAAMSDGHLDADEQGHLFREIDRLELSAEEKGMMLEELRHPWPMHAIVARCNAPETAIEVYTASVLAIDESRPESELYLSQLARLLQLPTTLVEEIHIRAGSEKALPLAEPA